MDMIEESRRDDKGLVKHAASPNVALITAAHKSNTSSRLPGLFDFTITRQIVCPHQCVIKPRDTGGPILAPIACDFRLRSVVHANVRRSECAIPLLPIVAENSD
jgi:hypothetical protein